MKLKRFVALVVSLAMVLSIVPAVSLTASAAEAPAPNAFTDELLEQMVVDATNVIDYSGNHNYNDADLNANWGWTSRLNNNLKANLKTYDGHDTLQLYNNSNNAPNAGGNVETSAQLQEATANKDFFVLEFLTRYSDNLGNNNTITIYSNTSSGTGAPGNSSEFLKFRYGKDGILPCTLVTQNGDTYGDSITGNQTNYVAIRAYVAKNSNGTYDIIWRVKNEETGNYETKSTVTGVASSRVTGGFKTLRCYYVLPNYQHVGFGDFKIYSGNYADIGNVGEVTVTYTVNGETVKTETKKYNKVEEAGAAFDSFAYAPDGENYIYAADAEVVSESKTIAMTKLANPGPYAVGDNVDYGSKQYKVVGENLIPNGDFSNGLAGWFNGNLVTATSDKFTVNSGEGTITMTGESGSSDATKRLYRTWAIEDGKTYLFTMYVDKANEYHRVSLANSAGTTDGGTFVFNGTTSAGENTAVFTNSGNSLLKVMFRWNNTDTVGNFALYEVEENTTAYRNVTVNYVYNGETLATEVLEGTTGSTVTAPAKNIAVENGIVVFNATEFTVGTTATEETLTYSKFVSAEGGLVANYNFANGDVTDSVNGLNGNVIGAAGVTFNKNGYVTLPGGIGQGAITIPGEIAKYLTGNFAISMWVRQDSSYESDANAIAFWDMAVDTTNRFVWQQNAGKMTIQHRGDPRVYTEYDSNNIQMKDNWALVTASFDLENGTLTTYINDTVAEATHQLENSVWAVANAPANVASHGNMTIYLGHNVWNNDANPEMKGDMADVRIYNKALTDDEVAALMAAKKTVTVKYMADGAEIVDSTVVEYFADEATFTLPTAVTSAAGTVYELTGFEYAEDAAEVTATTADAEYVAEYKAVEAIPTGIKAIDAVKVIDGNAPILPSTVTVLTNKAGIEYVANVAWNTANLVVGENTVTGTIEGFDIVAEVTVTVFEETFTLGTADSINGNGGNVIYFPVEIADEFHMEFDYTVNQIKDVSLQLGYNGNLFSAAAFGISPNGNQLKVTGGNKAGTSEGIVLIDPVNAGDTFHMFLTADASLDTYTLTVTTADGTVFTTGEKGFRTAQNAINTITLITNGGGADGDITVSNIKVSSASAEALKQEFTVVTVVDGEEESSTTAVAFTADEITAEERDGYWLTKTVDGNTVTFTYVSVIDVTIEYTINGAVVKTETKEYDPLVSEGVAFDAVTYSANGLNAIYEAEAATYSESQMVELTARANNGTYAIGDVVVGSNGARYRVASANLIPNGDFADGTVGWFGGDGNQLGASVANNAVTLGDASGGNNTSLNQSWAIESGKTYFYTYNTTKANTWHITSLQNALKADENTTAAPVLVGTTNEGVYVGTLAASDSEGTNSFVFTNTDGYAYLQSAFRWTDATISNFGLYELEEDFITVDYTVNGEIVHSEKIAYNKEDSAAGSQYEYYYSPNGSNFMYRAQGFATEDTVVEMEPVINASEKAPGETFIEGEGIYEYLTGENLIPNGTFTLDLKGWYNGLGTEATADKFQVNKGGNITILASEGFDQAGALHRAWATEIGKTYVLTFDANVANAEYHVVSGKNDLTSTADGDIIRRYSEVGNNFVVFTAKHEYVQINFRWSQDNSVGTFGLYEVKQTGRAATVTYKADGEVVNEVTKTFGLTEFGVNFDEYYYAPNGAEVIYKAEAMTEVAHDTVVEMPALDNWTDEEFVGTTVTDAEGNAYVVIGENLIPNGDFSENLAGWYAANGTALSTRNFSVLGDGTIQVIDYNETNGGANQNGTKALGRLWPTEIGKTYVLTYYTDRESDEFHVVSAVNAVPAENVTLVDGAVYNKVSAAGTNNVVFTATDNYVQILFRWLGENAVLGNFGLYEVMETVNTVTVTYTLNGEEKHSITQEYNVAEYVDGYAFDHYHYSENGTNVMYYADEVTTHEDVTVELAEHENWAGYAVGDYVMHESIEEPSEDATDVETPEGEVAYRIMSGNLIPNGNFDHKLTGWYNGEGNQAWEGPFTVNNDGTITSKSNASHANYQSLYRYWEVEVGKTYLLTYTSSVDHSYQKFFGANEPAPINTSEGNANYSDIKIGSTQGENVVVFKATQPYVQMDFYYFNGATVGNFGLYEVTPSNVLTVNYRFDTTPNDDDPNDGEIVHTVSKSFVGDESIWIDEYYYSPLDSSVMYMLPGQYISLADDSNGDGFINLDVYQVLASTGAVTTRVANWSHEGFDATDLYTSTTGELDDVAYLVASRNLVPNGNFEHGLATWYNGLGKQTTAEYFEVHEERGTVTFLTNLASNTAGGIYESWKVTPGETYVAMCEASRDCATGTLTLTSDPDVDFADENYEILGTLKEGLNVVEFTVPEGMEYLQLDIGEFEGGEFGNFGIYKLETYIPFGENHPLEKTVIDGNAPVLPEYVVMEGDDTLHRVAWDASQLNALVYGDNTITGVMDNGETIEAVVEVYPKTDEREDQDSYNGQADLTSNGGNKRLSQPITGKFAIEMDVTVHENGDLWIILNDSEKTGDTSFFGKDSVLFGFYFDGEFYAQDGNGDGTREDMETLMVTAVDKTYRIFVRGDCETDKFSVTVTSPEGVSRTFEDLGFRTEAGKLDSIAMLTNSDGLGSFTATNIKIYDPENLQVRYVLDADKNNEVTDGDKELGISDLGDYFYGDTIELVGEERFYISYNDAETGKDMGHIVQSLEEYTIEVTPETSIASHAEVVLVKMIKEHAVVYDTFATANDGEWINPNNLLFAGSSGITNALDTDDDGNATTTGGGYVGAPRVPLLTFNITDSLIKEAENQAIRLNLYVAKLNQNIGAGDSMKLAVAEVSDLVVDEGTMYLPEDVANTANLIWSDQAVTQSAESDGSGRHTVNTRIGIDVTDMVHKAIAEGKETITFALYAPIAGAYIVNREEAILDARYQQHAAYLEVEDAYVIDVYGANKITKNGSAMQLGEDGMTTVIIPDDAAMRLYSDDVNVVAFVDDTNTYVYKENKAVKPYGNSESVRPVSLGLAMVNGAQVRYGDKVNEEGKVTEGNGLRFITTFDNNDTLAGFVAGVDGTNISYNSANFTMGVNVNADGSSTTAKIVAEKMQNEDVYTTAITNLAESNYNRNFTAVPYVEVKDTLNGDEVYVGNTPVVRSIYRVAAGILENHEVFEEDCEEGDYSLENQNLLNVLQAYVNQVGIRLTYSPNAEKIFTAREEGSGAYTHLEGEEESAFFDVSYQDNGDGSYVVTIKPLNFNTPVEIKSWWKDYVRINNNNSKVKGMITDDSIAEDGTLTFTFTVN